MFGGLATLAKPQKIGFIKRLIAKRKESAIDEFHAHVILSGTAQARLWNVGLQSVDFLATPEATITNILEKYWLPRIHEFHADLRQSQFGVAAAERQALEQQRMASLI